MLVELDPHRGAEQGKTRPAVIVSNDGANAAAARSDYGVITVVPLTSNVRTIRPYQALIPRDRSGLPVDSKAQTEQVRSISTERVVNAIGWLDAELMAEVDEALRVHLSL
ncbi:type II toxin-antitoxin system PemK/MazF family toxin [Agromyces protaetiae]|uniref:type II toxin-antitoxin system PemK/MazF family toxin n=1 Tax=Agromyces protaetiae TaxID=2509455 RepID=UPI001FB6B2A4|nr:type II toxin-antitoxin system PemK/MazF family toxin [Agromyces protaetiae]